MKKEEEYTKTKNMVNFTFGMCTTTLNTNRNNLLSYQWGVFTTTNIRRRLQHMLNVVRKGDVYIDTDCN